VSTTSPTSLRLICVTVSYVDTTLLRVVIPSLQTIEPGRLVDDPVNAFRTTGSNGSLQAKLMVMSPDIEIKQAAINKSAWIEYGGKRETVWHKLRCRNVISAQVVRGTRTFAAARKPG
jgi:hypothetical protein